MIHDILCDSSAGPRMVNVESAHLKNRKIFLTEDINPTICKMLIEQLLWLNAESPSEEIVLYINSPGGSVYDGLAVYDTIRMLRSPVRTVCIGTAASMGAILFLAAEKREMLPHTRIMIHDPCYAGGSYSGQKPHEIESELDNLKKVSNLTNTLIAERTGQSLEKVCRYTREDSYFDADEAIRFGLATDIVKSIY